ncbi:MAG: FprA family A-type flavoprotein [Tissierellia bacterium]|nr:FprA family A-type flavoprotein [Tissierellia bacterium]
MNLQTVKIIDGLHYLGVNDRQTEGFENMWPLPEGVAYNSYLIVDEKTCLLDTVRINKSDGFIESLKNLMGDRPLDYLVIHHMEPDHSGSIHQVLDLYPDVTLVGNKKTGEMLQDYFQLPLDHFLEVKTGDRLDLGSRDLQFVQTPMVHWPESMVSYDEKNKILFSQDIFGGFGTVDGGVFDDEVEYEVRMPEYRRYYTNIVGKYSMMAKKALDTVKELDIEIICPIHGYVWRKHPEKIIEDYTKWANYEVEDGVVIVYGSMYGNTEVMADQLARYLAEEGVRNIEIFDVSKTHPSYILSNAWVKKGLIIGSCTYNNSVFPLMHQLVHILEMNRLKNHVLGVFGSYGWSGGAVKYLKEFAERGKFDTLDTVVEAKGSMHEEEDEGLRKMAKEMAEKLKA